MDPDSALAEIRVMQKTIAVAREVAEGDGDDGGEAMMVDRLMELIEGLDGWLTQGGFLPEDWKRVVVGTAKRDIAKGEAFRIPDDLSPPPPPLTWDQARVR